MLLPNTTFRGLAQGRLGTHSTLVILVRYHPPFELPPAHATYILAGKPSEHVSSQHKSGRRRTQVFRPFKVALNGVIFFCRSMLSYTQNTPS